MSINKLITCMTKGEWGTGSRMFLMCDGTFLFLIWKWIIGHVCMYIITFPIRIASKYLCKLQGKRTILTYEVSKEAPHLFQCSTMKNDTLHQSLAFLPKCQCDVKNVEFAKAFRLTDTTIEPLSFKVPRVKVRNNIFPYWPNLVNTSWTPDMIRKTLFKTTYVR